MESVAEIIAALGGPTAFGVICGFTKNPGARGSDMRQRESIPVVYWPRIVEAAQARGLAIDNDVLVQAHLMRERPDRSTSPFEGAAA